jgi:hypothetical protein
VGPHAAVVVLEAAEGVEAEDFLAQAVEGVFRVFLFGAEGFPDVTEFVEKDIKLGVLNAAHPEFGFEMLDAEIENFVLGSGDVFLNPGAVVIGEIGIGFLGEALAGKEDGRERTIGTGQGAADVHEVGKAPTGFLPAVDEEEGDGDLKNRNDQLNDDSKGECCGWVHICWLRIGYGKYTRASTDDASIWRLPTI